MGFAFMIAYDAVGEPLCFTMLAYALLRRNDTYLQSPDPGSGALTEESGPAGARERAVTSMAAGVPKRLPWRGEPARA